MLTIPVQFVFQGVIHQAAPEWLSSNVLDMVGPEQSSSALQLALTNEALKRARLIVGAQAQMLAEQMEQGLLPSFDGPDALRLLAMILSQDDPPSFDDGSLLPAKLVSPVLA